MNELQHKCIAKLFGESYTVCEYHEIDSHTFYIIIEVHGRDHLCNLSMGKYFDRDDYYIWSNIISEISE